MIFGQTLFQSVLERLEAEDIERELEEPPTVAVRGLKTGFVARDLASEITKDTADSYSNLHSAYFAYPLDDDAPLPAMPKILTIEPDEPQMPPHLARLKLSEIAEDLALAATDTVESLARKRRAFAQDNHPDRVAAEWRDKANIRMKLANLLIDQAQKMLSQ